MPHQYQDQLQVVDHPTKARFGKTTIRVVAKNVFVHVLNTNGDGDLVGMQFTTKQEQAIEFSDRNAAYKAINSYNEL